MDIKKAAAILSAMETDAVVDVLQMMPKEKKNLLIFISPTIATKKEVIEKFSSLKQYYQNIPDDKKDNFIWEQLICLNPL